MIPDNGSVRQQVPERLLYPVKEVAVLLGVTEKKIWNLIYANELTARRLGRRRLVHRDDLDSYVKGLPSSADKPQLQDTAA